MAQPPRPWLVGADSLGNIYLSDFIRKCIWEIEAVGEVSLSRFFKSIDSDVDDAGDIFANSSCEEVAPPILRRGVVNTVLLFPGTFNPPTVHHAQMLTHVTRNAGQDLIIGSIVLFTSDVDEIIEIREGEEEGDPNTLSDQERVTLWRGNEIPVDWVWIFDLGVDLAYWKCSGWITTGDDRSGMTVNPSTGEPTSGMPSRSTWTRVEPIQEDVQRLARRKFVVGRRDLIGTAAFESLDEEQRLVESARKDWVCRRRASPRGSIRFVPHPPRFNNEACSSRRIRGLLMRTSPLCHYHLGLTLARFALDVPDLLEFNHSWVRTVAEHEEPDFALWEANMAQSDKPKTPEEDEAYRRQVERIAPTPLQLWGPNTYFNGEIGGGEPAPGSGLKPPRSAISEAG
ncbi:uncharacterized protein DNG_08302 [Cephalotrichum gorgonifer]|uniref:Cytidyltransferase-like domain-containing protein n=1 Tax=Cephalotrichum gorgonifer TaxID=2041049 RepID=A0AAE8N3H5_9PEZI|nr:uncharacterized protein DNG_08302 [Cephalotrichum gorgonifer]